ncbi:MAG TPA: hypothetical protein VE173_03145 [Longimicrobiales bacterium]|nr:hypothetical protein [Longimicrobiales bacterium]
MTVPGWLRRVERTVPEGFVPWLVSAAVESTTGGQAEALEGAGGRLPEARRLLDAAAVALSRCLSPRERERHGAFDLLAADAFVTWAAEAALDSDEPDGVLREMVDGLARGGWTTGRRTPDESPGDPPDRGSERA